MDIALGVAVGALIICGGLWGEARYPQLPGATPNPGFHTVLTDLGYGAIRQDDVKIGQLESLASEWPNPQWMGTIRTRQIAVLPEQAVEMEIDLVFGPLLDRLAVQMSGPGLSHNSTTLPLTAAPVREIVLTRRMATRFFGTPEAALGQFLDFGTVRWRLGVDDLAAFRVVGVVSDAFQGIDIERPVEAWIGINGWWGVLFPEQQVDDVRRSFGAHTLAVIIDDPTRFSSELQRSLADLGEPGASVVPVPGAGYHPERRLRFLILSEAVLLSLISLVLLTISCTAALAWVRSVRAIPEDFVRRAIGETPAGRGVRKLLALLPTMVVVSMSAGAVLAMARLVQPYGLPLNLAIAHALATPATWLFVAMLAVTLIIFQVMHAGEARVTAFGAHRPERLYAALFAFVFCLLAIASYSGSIGAQRAASSLSVPLPESVLDARVIALDPKDRRWLFDRNSVTDLAHDLALSGIAMAGAGPAGGRLPGERVRMIAGDSEYPAVVHINPVGSNYFSVIGVPVPPDCGPLDRLRPDTVIANERFMERYGRGLGNQALSLRREGGEVLTICGTLADAHVGDARAGLAPVLYEALRERRHARVLVGKAAGVEALDEVETRITNYFPGLEIAEIGSVRAVLRTELAQERGIFLLNVALALVAGAVAMLTVVMLLNSVLEMNLRNMAIRRALGSSMWRLAIGSVFGGSPGLWLGAAALIVAAVSASALFISLTPVQIGGGIGAAVVITASVALATLSLVPTRLNDRMLARNLTRDH